MKPKKVAALLAALALCLAIALIAASCSAEEKPSQQSEEDALVEKSRADMALTWAATPEADKDQICLGLDLYGWEWTKTNFQAHVPPERRDETNWDAAVAYTVERCSER